MVPVLSDADGAARLVGQVRPRQEVEVLIVDGGGDSRLDELGALPHVDVIRTAPGRGRQMNAGAAVATGEWLLFLHADSLLPDGWEDAVRDVPAAAIGGWFRFALDDPAWQARVIERGVALRVRLFRLPYGDQGLLVRSRVFRALGGFADLPLLEDVEFVRRLVQAGPVVQLPLPLVTSARRWRRDGWFRRSARNLAIVSGYFAGVPPRWLARRYSLPPSAGRG